MRVEDNEINLTKWLLDIGRGYQNGQRSDEILVPPANQSDSLDELIKFCFPPNLFEEPLLHAQTLCDAALLCPRNEDVAAINAKAIREMSGELTTIESLDIPLKNRPNAGNIDWHDPFRSDYNIEAIHNETPTGLPPHTLELKV